MRFDLLPPRHQLTEIMLRLYEQGLTTTSGGNLSIHDEDGSIWITPASVDKGRLTPDDIVRVLPDGTAQGRHAPSSELPFHRRIYLERPDIRAIVHAHPTALVAFSLVGQVPEGRLTPQTFDVCGAVGYAPYALPGTEALGERIAQAFGAGPNVVMLENHGVVAGSDDVLRAFHRLETLEFSAQTQINAASLGPIEPLTAEQVALFRHDCDPLPEFAAGKRQSAELEGRRAIVDVVKRAYARRLMTSTGGTVSLRLGADDFLITPYGFDRKYIEASDIVRILNGQREVGRTPSRAVRLHRAIYAAHPYVNCIMSAQPPAVLSFGVTRSVPFDTKLIPETYIVLREMPVVDYGLEFTAPEQVAQLVSPQTPVLLLRNDAVLATGSTLLQAFDRVEVAEFSAAALLRSRALGALRVISEDDVRALQRKYFPEES
jgi:L-fuculose-phosphate aldolase